MLKNLITETKKLKRIDLIKKHVDYPILLQQTDFLNQEVPIRQRVWHIVNDVFEIPVCKTCKINKVNWRKTTYVDYCSMKCMANSDKVKNSRKMTCMEKYGVENPTQSKAIKEKTKQTNLERYGVEYVLQDSTIRKAISETCLIKYGNVCSLHGKDVKEKVKRTNLARYGSEYASQTEDFKKKVRTTNLKSCGKEYYPQLHITDENFTKLYDREWLIEQHHINEYAVSKISEMLGVTPRTVLLRFNEFDIHLKFFGHSSGEKEILKFIKGHYNGEVISNSRELIYPYEIDIYLPTLNLALEYNGTYWHSELNGKDRQYHLNKTKLCNEKGIQLIHIWEHDWESKTSIVESIILAKLNLLPIKLNARECEVVLLDSKKIRSFVTDNHIQGYAHTSINLTLLHNNEIVSVMTFSKSRYTNNIQYELVRFVSKINTNVRGAASKLFSYFVKNYNPMSILSYSDIGRNKGNIYNILGFKYSHTSSPNFKYLNLNTMELYSRLKFQKHKQEKILELYDSELSAWQNMKDNGYDRIWDCGNDVYVWRNE